MAEKQTQVLRLEGPPKKLCCEVVLQSSERMNGSSKVKPSKLLVEINNNGGYAYKKNNST